MPRTNDDKNELTLPNCLRAKFPQCLEATLDKFFEGHGRQKLDFILETIGEKPEQPSSIDAIPILYDSYMQKVRNQFGEIVFRALEFESFGNMNFEHCLECPVYRSQLVQ